MKSLIELLEAEITQKQFNTPLKQWKYMQGYIDGIRFTINILKVITNFEK